MQKEGIVGVKGAKERERKRNMNTIISHIKGFMHNKPGHIISKFLLTWNIFTTCSQSQKLKDQTRFQMMYYVRISFNPLHLVLYLGVLQIRTE